MCVQDLKLRLALADSSMSRRWVLNQRVMVSMPLPLNASSVCTHCLCLLYCPLLACDLCSSCFIKKNKGLGRKFFKYLDF